MRTAATSPARSITQPPTRPPPGASAVRGARGGAPATRPGAPGARASSPSPARPHWRTHRCSAPRARRAPRPARPGRRRSPASSRGSRPPAGSISSAVRQGAGEHRDRPRDQQQCREDPERRQQVVAEGVEGDVGAEHHEDEQGHEVGDAERELPQLALVLECIASPSRSMLPTISPARKAPR